MYGLKTLFIGLIVLLSVGFSWGDSGVVSIKGDLFNYKTRGLIILLEQSGYRYEVVGDDAGRQVFVDIDGGIVRINDKSISINFGYADVLRELLKERKEDWSRVLFIIDAKNKGKENIEDVLKEGKYRYIIVGDDKELRRQLDMARRDKRNGFYAYIAVGEGKELLNQLIVPIGLMRDFDKLNIFAITKSICNELVNVDYLSGLRNTEIYSFVSCVNVGEEATVLREKLEGDIYSAIISLEIKNLILREAFGKDVNEWNIFSNYQIQGNYQYELKGYRVSGNGLIPINLVKQIELK